MTIRRKDGDETWNRLINWSKGQRSERLAAHILNSEGFKSIDPSHPLGGKDGIKDIVMIKDNLNWIAAAYFPRGPKTFNVIKTKFKADLSGILKANASGIAFVTNQELTLKERKILKDLSQPFTADIFHLERISHILDTPANYGIRLEYLDLELTKEEQLAYFAIKDNKLNNLIERIDLLMVDYGSFKRSFDLNTDLSTFEIRSEEEVSLALERMVDQIWYNRHQTLKHKVQLGKTTVNPDIWQGAIKAAKKMEERYGEENLWHQSDFEWGMLNGKVSALRWILGDEWDMLDT